MHTNVTKRWISFIYAHNHSIKTRFNNLHHSNKTNHKWRMGLTVSGELVMEVSLLIKLAII